MSSIRDVVKHHWRLHDDIQSGDKAKAHAFWRKVTTDDAALSPDLDKVSESEQKPCLQTEYVSQVGYRKWTSEVIVQSLSVLYNSKKGQWAQNADPEIRAWFHPIRPATVIIVCTMIMLACYEKLNGGGTTPLNYERDSGT